MKAATEKNGVKKSFCALVIAALMGCGSLISVAAAIATAAATEPEPQTVNSYDDTEADTEPLSKKVLLDVNGSKRTVLTAGRTVAEVLRSSGVTVSDSRIVRPGLSAAVTPYMVVTVRDAKRVSLTADGKTEIVKLALGRLDESLRLSGIALGSEDILSVPRDSEVAEIDSLTIHRVTYKQTGGAAANSGNCNDGKAVAKKADGRNAE